MKSLNFDNAMYQTNAIFQKSSGFLEWEPISSSSEKYIVYILENSIKRH